MTVHYDLHKICPVCEHTFYFDTTKASPGTWAAQVYCSPRCARKHDNDRYRRGNNSARGKPVGTPNSQVAVFEDPTHLPRDWRHRAICRDEDPELFFAVGDSGPARQQNAEAKSVCRRCPVRDECLTWALKTGQVGVWGGKTEEERREINRRNSRMRAGAL